MFECIFSSPQNGQNLCRSDDPAGDLKICVFSLNALKFFTSLMLQSVIVKKKKKK